MENPRERIREIEKRLAQLPKGTLTYKTINGKKQPYVQRTVDGRSVSYYVKVSERAQILMEFAERKRLVEERKHLLAYREGLAADHSTDCLRIITPLATSKTDRNYRNRSIECSAVFFRPHLKLLEIFGMSPKTRVQKIFNGTKKRGLSKTPRSRYKCHF